MSSIAASIKTYGYSFVENYKHYRKLNKDIQNTIQDIQKLIMPFFTINCSCLYIKSQDIYYVEIKNDGRIRAAASNTSGNLRESASITLPSNPFITFQLQELQSKLKPLDEECKQNKFYLFFEKIKSIAIAVLMGTISIIGALLIMYGIKDNFLPPTILGLGSLSIPLIYYLGTENNTRASQFY